MDERNIRIISKTKSEGLILTISHKTKWICRMRLLYVIKTLSSFEHSVSITKLAQKTNMARLTIKGLINNQPELFLMTITAENRTYIVLNRESKEVKNFLNVIKTLFHDDGGYFKAFV